MANEVLKKMTELHWKIDELNDFYITLWKEDMFLTWRWWKKKLWKIKNPLFPHSPIDFSYQLGLFFVTTIWVFKLTFGNFKKYLLLNVVIHYLLSYPILKALTKFGLFEFKN